MKISKTVSQHLNAVTLYLLVKNYKGKFKICLFDKRDNYKFKVFNYPYLDGNIPEIRNYDNFICQLIVFCSINNILCGFNNYVNKYKFVIKSCNQGLKLARVRNKIFYSTF